MYVIRRFVPGSDYWSGLEFWGPGGWGSISTAYEFRYTVYANRVARVEVPAGDQYETYGPL